MSDFFIFISYMIGGSVGAAVGSFLGVVIERGSRNSEHLSRVARRASSLSGRPIRLFGTFLKSDSTDGQFPRKMFRSFLSERSLCLDCGHKLAWWENIPVFSFVFLKGRCSRCHSPIPYWLPLIEIAGAAGGIWVVSQIAPLTKSPMAILNGAALALIASALVWIFFSDLVYGVISDWAVTLGVLGTIIEKFAKLPITPQSFANFISLLWPAVAVAAFFWLLVMVTRGRGMGTGDITLSFFLGLFLGWPLILVGVWLAFVIGAICGIGLIVLGKKKFGQTIPFGPLLIIGAIISSGWGQFFLDKWLWFVVK